MFFFVKWLVLQDGVGSSDMPMALTPRMPHAGSALSEPQASSELLFRLNHARQTVEFVQRQVSSLAACTCHSGRSLSSTSTYET